MQNFNHDNHTSVNKPNFPNLTNSTFRLLDSEKSSSLDIEELVEDYNVNSKFVENKKNNTKNFN